MEVKIVMTAYLSSLRGSRKGINLNLEVVVQVGLSGLVTETLSLGVDGRLSGCLIYYYSRHVDNKSCSSRRSPSRYFLHSLSLST